ncbi:hypothetical protein PAXRUDRAFT_36591 [Paxillus rubicundulus Ve08.2h10]|uniref:Ubiquitin-like protease family profile domain-containing protein n=1 Tax=Paxillus rubicundulus Ve08.2h10 TaxID=930991 RepID=A0A0D0D4U6_9AGAM|nr:hypothetical protein PAXRUDRAFT_36591 [Paxillus rubicundulus Ve08.2h10]
MHFQMLILGHAVQWHDILQVRLEQHVESIIQQCCDIVQTASKPMPPGNKLLPLALSSASPQKPQGLLLSGSCDIVLVQHCPACSGAEGGDIHVATDSNFHHHHQCSAGSCLQFYEPTYFLPKSQVDCIGSWIKKASYEAADRKKQKTAMDSFDDTSMMALICHHNIPLFFANIDPPGEQQKYSFALLEHLFMLLLSNANIVALYDIGCFDILGHNIVSCLQFATTATNAHGHKWACQLHQHHIWLIDCQASAICLEMQNDLGDWIQCWLKKGITNQDTTAQKVLDSSKLVIVELQAQCASQHAAQLSLDAPARLKKEFDTILTLKVDLETSDKALQATHTMIGNDNTSENTLEALNSLECSHEVLVNKVNALYASLNVHDRFPELEGVNLEFVQTLLLAFNSGMKLHQQTCKAIVKCQPTLMSEICKFNWYCKQLELYNPSFSIPLPTPLPTKLMELHSNQSLLEDVWITPSTGEILQWLEDCDVREGISALLKHEHCHEEQCHLGIKVDNMCRWFGWELRAIELTLHKPENSVYSLLLQKQHEALMKLQECWPTPLASSICYGDQIKIAIEFSATQSRTPNALDLIGSNPFAVALTDVLLEDEDPVDVEDNGEEAEKPPMVTLELQIPFLLLEDPLDISNNMQNIVPGVVVVLIHPPMDGFPRQIFEPNDIGILASSDAQLNDTCINGCDALLYPTLSSDKTEQCAILSTHNLPHICYNTNNDTLWCNSSWTQYWEKPIWILPINQPPPVGHWVMCTIDFCGKHILLFDSLAEQKPWRNDLKDIIQLIHQLSKGVPIQTNGFDCGLWVLDQTAVVLRGYGVTGLQENNMVTFPCFPHHLIIHTPVVNV